MKKFRKIHFLIVVSLLLIALVGCEWFDRKSSDAPTAPATTGLQMTREDVNPVLTYQACSTPGITVTADLSASHIAGQPYGDCTLYAAWRKQDRVAVIETHVTMSVDNNGMGTALIPASFLDTVFKAAADEYAATKDTSVWFHTPGLYMNLMCDPSMYK